MKVTKLERQQNKAFTLIEMIGVLAVIAILAALLIPKVFQAINEARINTVPVGAATCKTAVIDHYAKYGALNQGVSAFGELPAQLTIPAGGYTDYDSKVLMVEGFLDKPFAPRVGVGGDIILDNVSTATTAAGTEGQTYWLSGQGSNTNEVTGAFVIYAMITNVPAADAQAISARIDGASLSAPETPLTTADLRGRVKYAQPASAGAAVDVFIYLTHR